MSNDPGWSVVPAIDVVSQDEIRALAAAAADQQDAALFLTAALSGLRQGELLALRWGDLDLGLKLVRVRRNFTHGAEGTPKSGRERVVPMVGEVRETLATLRARGHWTDDDDIVFCNDVGAYRSASWVSTRYKLALKRARLRPLRFHDPDTPSELTPSASRTRGR